MKSASFVQCRAFPSSVSVSEDVYVPLGGNNRHQPINAEFMTDVFPTQESIIEFIHCSKSKSCLTLCMILNNTKKLRNKG